MSVSESKHEFALYVPNLGALLVDVVFKHQLLLTDLVLVHRIYSVLRVEPGEIIVLFDRQMYARCRVQMVSKREVTCVLEEKSKNIVLQPAITFFLPLLKKEDLETALYSLVELGANIVQLVITEKSRDLGAPEREKKELDRLERIMIAAAEQSKQFAIPELRAPILFEQMSVQIQKKTAPFIFFDPDGYDLYTVLTEVRTAQPTEIFLLVGPEGDLTAHEKMVLEQVPVRLCKLTPTVLRSVSAVAVGMGCMRSVF